MQHIVVAASHKSCRTYRVKNIVDLLQHFILGLTCNVRKERKTNENKGCKIEAAMIGTSNEALRQNLDWVLIPKVENLGVFQPQLVSDRGDQSKLQRRSSYVVSAVQKPDRRRCKSECVKIPTSTPSTRLSIAKLVLLASCQNNMGLLIWEPILCQNGGATRNVS